MKRFLYRLQVICWLFSIVCLALAILMFFATTPQMVMMFALPGLMAATMGQTVGVFR